MDGLNVMSANFIISKKSTPPPPPPKKKWNHPPTQQFCNPHKRGLDPSNYYKRRKGPTTSSKLGMCLMTMKGGMGLI